MASLLIAACVPAAAQNWFGVLKNTPAELFNDDDQRLFLDATKKALNDTPVGETVKWENPKTGSHGELKVLKTFTWKDHPCRQIRVNNEAGDRKGSSSPNLCRIEDKWRIVSPSELKG